MTWSLISPEGMRDQLGDKRTICLGRAAIKKRIAVISCCLLGFCLADGLFPYLPSDHVKAELLEPVLRVTCCFWHLNSSLPLADFFSFWKLSTSISDLGMVSGGRGSVRWTHCCACCGSVSQSTVKH